MAFKLGTSFAERSFCFIAILASVSAATLRAQTSGENDAYSFSSAVLPLSLCGQSADGCLPNSAALGQDGLNPNHANSSNSRRQNDWVHAWARKVDEARASQPHFIAPMVTTHVMLVQQYRYDMSWQQDSPGHTVTSNYGASRGLEIIPATRFEVGVSPPNYIAHQSNQKDGVGDLAWQVKFRAFSAPEHKGDYFVGFFMGGSFPVGSQPNGTGHTILSPTFAAAKGLGSWDIQSTVGANLPMSGTSTLGRTIIFNTAVNYRIKGKVWPMLEQNSTFWSGGAMDGRKQV